MTTTSHFASSVSRRVDPAHERLPTAGSSSRPYPRTHGTRSSASSGPSTPSRMNSRADTESVRSSAGRVGERERRRNLARWWRQVSAVGVTCALATGCAATHLDVGHPASLVLAGKPVAPNAPDFTLTANTCARVSPSETLSTGPVVLVSYRGHWCPWCRLQLGELAREHGAFVARAETDVAISVDERDDSVAFARAYDIPFPLLDARDGPVSRAYVGIDVERLLSSGRRPRRRRRSNRPPESRRRFRRSRSSPRARETRRRAASGRRAVEAVTSRRLWFHGSGPAASRVWGTFAARLDGDSETPAFGARASASALVPFGRTVLGGALVRAARGDTCGRRNDCLALRTGRRPCHAARSHIVSHWTTTKTGGPT